MTERKGRRQPKDAMERWYPAIKNALEYYHFREWSEQGSLQRFLVRLVKARRRRRKQPSMPVTAVIDSQSVRSGLLQSEKGIDGNKKVKGIKRHIAMDSNGYPLAVAISTANVHDSKVATALISDLTEYYPCIQLIKADGGYRGCEPSDSEVWTMECVKTNFGSRNFIAAGGRWVVNGLSHGLKTSAVLVGTMRNSRSRP